eukprot:8880764-Karenia_brevis.AAC.1
MATWELITYRLKWERRRCHSSFISCSEIVAQKLTTSQHVVSHADMAALKLITSQQFRLAR